MLSVRLVVSIFALLFLATQGRGEAGVFPVSAYPSMQAAVDAACAAGGGRVELPHRLNLTTVSSSQVATDVAQTGAQLVSSSGWLGVTAGYWIAAPDLAEPPYLVASVSGNTLVLEDGFGKLAGASGSWASFPYHAGSVAVDMRCEGVAIVGLGSGAYDFGASILDAGSRIVVLGGGIGLHLAGDGHTLRDFAVWSLAPAASWVPALAFGVAAAPAKPQNGLLHLENVAVQCNSGDGVGFYLRDYISYSVSSTRATNCREGYRVSGWGGGLAFSDIYAGGWSRTGFRVTRDGGGPNTAGPSNVTISGNSVIESFYTILSDALVIDQGADTKVRLLGGHLEAYGACIRSNGANGIFALGTFFSSQCGYDVVRENAVFQGRGPDTFIGSYFMNDLVYLASPPTIENPISGMPVIHDQMP